ALDASPERRLLLSVSGEDLPVESLEKLILPLSAYSLGGSFGARLEFVKNLDAAAAGLDIRGAVTLDKVQAKDRRSGRGVERASGEIAFRGRDARSDRLLLSAGASEVAVAAVADITQPALRYSLRAAKLKPSDFFPSSFSKSDEMKSV